MQRKTQIVLPYEPGYTGYREAARRRQETREWLRRREQMARRSPQDDERQSDQAA